MELEPLKLLLDLFEQFAVLVIKTLRVQYHLLEVEHILLETAGHFFDLYQLVAVVLIEDALDADGDRTKFAEVLDGLVEMARTVDECGRVQTIVAALS